ncbi:hypothetical protein [Roseateles microcysteis]|uniref:hypothetical protein n=1 Tax=Roseateles microcysteis TaxID=3119057 RepID=UPI002FE64DB1
MNCTAKISVTATDEHTIVAVGDRELFDYFDDFFVERGFECICVSLAEPGDEQMNSFYFSSEFTPAMLSKVVSEVPPSEIERILSLNAKQG